MPLASSEIKVDMTGTLLSFSLPLSLSRIKISAATTIANIITGMSIPNTTHNFDFCSLFSFTIFSPVLSLLLELKHWNLIHNCHFLILKVFLMFLFSYCYLSFYFFFFYMFLCQCVLLLLHFYTCFLHIILYSVDFFFHHANIPGLFFNHRNSGFCLLNYIQFRLCIFFTL